MKDRPRYAGFLPGAHLIEGYGKGGFLFAGMSHQGSILVLPSGIHAWKPLKAEEADEAAFRLVLAEPPGSVELLLFGGGASLSPMPKLARAALAQAGIRVELMSTGSATATYNLLLEERRPVAAALIATL